MQNLNPYNRYIFESNFKTTETYQKLIDKYKSVSFDKFNEIRWIMKTPRDKLTSVLVSVAPWYYLDYLDSSKQIYDLGCGMNFFKPYFPNLVGVGAETNREQFFGDVFGVVDQDYCQTHKNTYDGLISINALHFQPLEELISICTNFADMLKSGSRGYITFNINVMIQRSLLYKDYSPEQVESYIRNQFDNFPFDILVFDLDLSTMDAWLDGNLRIVVAKP